jgi:hypothetical protein
MEDENMIKKKILTGALAAMMLIGTVGCGSAGNKYEKAVNVSSSARTDNSHLAGATEAAAVYEDYDYEMADENYSYSKSDGLAGASSAVAPESASSESGSSDSDSTTPTLSEIDTEKLVYHCDLNFDTENYDNSIAELKNLMNKYGAFLEYENERNNAGYGNTPSLRIYNATIRIPSENYQVFLDSTGNIGELMYKCQDVDNLSQEYSDLTAELEVLETKRDSYIAMMKEAKTLDDMESLLMIDERLTEVEVSINRIKTRMRNINNDVAYSYITVNISEVREYEDPVPETFGQRVSQAFKDGWKHFKEACQNFVIWAAENIIAIGIFIIIILTIWFAFLRKPVKAFRAKRRAAKAAKKAAKAAAAQNATVQNEASQNADAQNPTTQNTTASSAEAQNTDSNK